MCGVYPTSDVRTAGDQISSTYEGRHLTLREDELVHPYHSDTYVDEGEQVCFCLDSTPTDYGWGVGVAFNSGTADSDMIAIDTEGIWALQVYAEDDSGNSAVNVGDALYMRVGNLVGAADADGTGDCEISKIRNLSTQVFLGYALGTIAEGSDGVIAVKVHFSPEEQQDEYINFDVTVTAADEAKSFNITNNSAGTTDYPAGVGINYTIGASLTGGWLSGLSVYFATPGASTLTQMTGISIYQEALGALTVATLVGIDIGMDNTNAATADAAFLRLYNHGTGTMESVVLLGNAGGTPITDFITALAAVAPIDGTAHGDTDGGRISCHVGGAQRYLYLYTN